MSSWCSLFSLAAISLRPPEGRTPLLQAVGYRVDGISCTSDLCVTHATRGQLGLEVGDGGVAVCDYLGELEDRLTIGVEVGGDFGVQGLNGGKDRIETSHDVSQFVEEAAATAKETPETVHLKDSELVPGIPPDGTIPASTRM